MGFKIEASDIEETSSIPYLKLNDGNAIPMLAYGLGTANFKAGNTGIDYKIVNVTAEAIKAGFRHIDGAEAYGNEQELGLAIKRAGVPRENLYIVTKFYNFSCRPKQAIRASLERLELDYVDLYLIHAPFLTSSSVELQGFWAELEDIKKAGHARSIGVSNFSVSHLETILETATIPPSVNQIEYHPHLQQTELLDFQKKHNIVVAAYGPLLPLNRNISSLVPGIWRRLAKKHGVSESDVGLRWSIEQGVVAITTTSRSCRMRSILSHLPEFSLSQDEVNSITEAGKAKRFRGFWSDAFPSV
ncbi:aldo/keto reductase [Colletotrichum cereale]|nr:aldo/keto reductase [Colletotrichum cereale]